MPTYHTTIRLFDVAGPDAATARQAIEEKLQAAGLGRWQIVSLTPEAPPLPVRQRRTRPKIPPSRVGPILMLGALAWALWFYWLLLE